MSDVQVVHPTLNASMKAPPNRKGNLAVAALPLGITDCLNENPSQEEGKSRQSSLSRSPLSCLNESPSQKEGKSAPSHTLLSLIQHASMKALPKRKGNPADDRLISERLPSPQ
nr:hypothetical protein [Rothia mucilaginosa]